MAERTIVTLGDTLAALVEGKKYTTLRDILVTMNAVEVAAGNLRWTRRRRSC